MCDAQIRYMNARALTVWCVLTCLKIVKNVKIFIFVTARVDAARVHEAQIIKAMPLFTCLTKTDAALVFRLIHVYNLRATLTQTHNVAHFFIILFVRACPLVVREILVVEKLSAAIHALYHFDLRVSARRRNITTLTCPCTFVLIYITEPLITIRTEKTQPRRAE